MKSSSWLWLVIGALFVVLFAWVLGGGFWGVNRVDVVREAWATSAGSLDEMVAGHPHTPKNATAAALESQLARLGIENRSKGSTPPKDGRRTYAQVHGALSAYVKAEAALRRGDPIGEPPKAVQAWLDERDAELRRLEQSLIEGAPVVWETDLAQAIRAPIPPMRILRDIGLVLRAAALARARKGDLAGGQRALEADWVLGESLWQRVDMLPYFAWMVGVPTHLGVLRRLDGASSDWDIRLEEFDPPARASLALKTEAWSMLEMARGKSGWPVGTTRFGPGARYVNALLAPFELPLLRLSMANYADDLRLAFVAVRGMDPCVSDPAVVAASSSSVRGSPMTRFRAMGSPDKMVGRMWATAFEGALDAELTRQVLRARAESPRHWPLRNAPSAVCRGAQWTHTVRPDGGLEIALDRARVGAPPPTFTLPRPRR